MTLILHVDALPLGSRFVQHLDTRFFLALLAGQHILDERTPAPYEPLPTFVEFTLVLV